MNDWWQYVVAGGASFISNILWAFYIKYVAESSRLKAAIFGEMILVTGAVVTYNYIHNLWLLIPIVIGGFLGTFFNEDIKQFFGIDKGDKKNETKECVVDAEGSNATTKILEKPGQGTHSKEIQQEVAL